VSPIVVDPQLPPLLQLLHLEVLVVAGLVVVTRVVVVVRTIVWATGEITMVWLKLFSDNVFLRLDIHTFSTDVRLFDDNH
jgi:hypothetical protein